MMIAPPGTLGELLVAMTALRKRCCRHRQEHTTAGLWTIPELLEQQFCYVRLLHELRQQLQQAAPGLKPVFLADRQCYVLLPVVPESREKA